MLLSKLWSDLMMAYKTPPIIFYKSYRHVTDGLYHILQIKSLFKLSFMRFQSFGTVTFTQTFRKSFFDGYTFGFLNQFI